jgi:exopolysaccharide biosynthesis glycosyltransferase PssC
MTERTGSRGARAADDPVHVAVAIITFRRPDGVQHLLSSLRSQKRSAERPFCLTAVVVDNDAQRSAEATVAAFAATPGFRALYVHEARQGIPIARNAALAAVPADADFLCFIDDDEWPCEPWLDAFLELVAHTDADCVYGPVEPVYPAEAPRWFVRSRIFERRRFADGTRLSIAASNNVMIATSFLRRTKLRFDERMRFTGGSDYLFFRQAVACGLTIRWAEQALVYDSIPRSRMRWSWIFRRQYRIGNTFAVSERILGRRSLLIRRSLVGIARVGGGVLVLPMLVVSPYYGMRGVTHMLRGLGMLVGLMGHRLEEYAPGAMALDRPS